MGYYRPQKRSCGRVQAPICSRRVGGLMHWDMGTYDPQDTRSGYPSPGHETWAPPCEHKIWVPPPDMRSGYPPLSPDIIPGYHPQDMRPGYYLLVISSVHHWRHVQTCSLDPSPPPGVTPGVTVRTSGQYASYWNAYVFVARMDDKFRCYANNNAQICTWNEKWYT